jgi:hypothetical protein
MELEFRENDGKRSSLVSEERLEGPFEAVIDGSSGA